MARTVARAAAVALLATTAAFVVVPVRCAQTVTAVQVLQVVLCCFIKVRDPLRSIIDANSWQYIARIPRPRIHTRPSVERRRVLPRKTLSSSGRTVSPSKLTLHAGKNMGRRSLLQQVGCQISGLQVNLFGIFHTYFILAVLGVCFPIDPI